MNKAITQKARIDVKLPLVYLHTPFGLRFFDRVASWRITKAYASMNTYLMPLITVAAMAMIVGSLGLLLASPEARASAREVSPAGNLMIPGINPYLPVGYGFVALVSTIIIHEIGHGIIARVHKLEVESTGIVFLLILPIGAFVNIKPDDFKAASLRKKSAILTGGPMNNMIFAGISFALLYLVVSTMVPVDGASEQAKTVLERYTSLFSTNPLATLAPPTIKSIVPFSDAMSPNYQSPALGPMYQPVANMLFWLWFVNFNLGIFNALPIGPLDGGQLYGSVISKVSKSRITARNANIMMSVVIAGIVVALMALPHLGVW